MRTARLILLPLALAGIACGDSLELTTGEGPGTTGFAVIITDDPANDPTPGPARVGPRAFSGTMDGSIRVALRSDGGALVDLGLAQDAFIELQEAGDSLTLADLTRPAVDTYVGIQLRFEGVVVTIDSGSGVGDTTLTQNAVLDVGNGLATVEIATLPFDVDSETAMDIVVDLNSERWVTTTNIEDTEVSQADLANNVTVEIQ